MVAPKQSHLRAMRCPVQYRYTYVRHAAENNETKHAVLHTHRPRGDAEDVLIPPDRPLYSPEFEVKSFVQVCLVAQSIQQDFTSAARAFQKSIVAS